MKKSNLDEMQELQLLRIEHNGCWLAFWLLLAAMLIQLVVYRPVDMRTVAGEWVVFMVLALYLAIACARRGIWDRRLAMNTKTNIAASAVAAVVVGAVNAVVIYRNYQKPVGTIIAVVITVSITFILCLAALTFTMKQTIKRQAAMEAEPADTDEI